MAHRSRAKEIRCNPDTELRATDGTEDRGPLLSGYAAVFDRVTDLGWGVREVVRPGAFTNTLKGSPDIRALWNHDTNIVLGRTKAETLTLREDEKGLFSEIIAPKSASQYVEAVQRGDVSQMSFGFRVIKDTWTKKEKDGNITLLRELQEVQLFEVSPVAFPAYRQTSVKVRNLLEEFGIDSEDLCIALQGQDTEVISAVRDLSSLLRTEPVAHPGNGDTLGSKDQQDQRRILWYKNAKRLNEYYRTKGRITL